MGITRTPSNSGKALVGSASNSQALRVGPGKLTSHQIQAFWTEYTLTSTYSVGCEALQRLWLVEQWTFQC